MPREKKNSRYFNQTLGDFPNHAICLMQPNFLKANLCGVALTFKKEKEDSPYVVNKSKHFIILCSCFVEDGKEIHQNV